MLKIYYKTKILINGLFPLINYEIDNYIEKTGKYNENIIDTNSDEYIFYASGFLLKGLYSCSENEGVFYEYFENDEPVEKELPNDISKEDVEKIMLNELINEVGMLEKKLRLLSGFGINLPVFRTTIYNFEKKNWTSIGFVSWSLTPLNIRDYNIKTRRILEQRLQFHISNSTIQKLENKNQRFKRALYFYNNSFLSRDIGIRFTLLFSALESLFNITGKNVTEEVANYSSRILFLSRKDRKKSKYIIKTYYDVRSKFIHGNNYILSLEMEQDFRDYVREILFIYWNISIIYKIYDPKEIKKLVLNTDRNTLDIQVQLFIKYLRTSPDKFKELYSSIKTRFLNVDYKILNNENLIIKN